MPNTYCGKSCAECTYKEELSCPGCQAGPGKPHYAECDLAQCCQDKCHETCETCQLQPHCGKLRGKERIPEYRIKSREAERANLEKLAKRAPVLGKWLWVLFWLVIPSTVASLMTNEDIMAALPALFVPGTVLQAVTLLVHVFALWQLGKLEERYKTAAVCALAGIVTTLASLLTGGENEGWTLLITIPAAIVIMVGKYNEFTAHSIVLQGMDYELSNKWSNLWKWYIGCYGAILGCILLVIIAPVLGLLVMLAALVGLIVVGIVEMVYLYKTAKQFRMYAALPTESM